MASQSTTPRHNTENKHPRVSADAQRPIPVVPKAGAERKRRMSEIIAQVADEDRELLIKLAR